MDIKSHTHAKKVGYTSEFLFGIYWWTWKELFIKKTAEVGQEKCKNFNIYNVAFKK